MPLDDNDDFVVKRIWQNDTDFNAVLHDEQDSDIASAINNLSHRVKAGEQSKAAAAQFDADARAAAAQLDADARAAAAQLDADARAAAAQLDADGRTALENSLKPLKTMLFLTEQEGATDRAKLQAALTKAALQDYAVIVGHGQAVIELINVLEIPANTRLIGNGMIIKGVPAGASVRCAADSDNISVEGVIFEGRGTGNIIEAKGAHNFSFKNNEIRNFSGRAIDVSSSSTRGFKNILIADNYLHSPVSGVGHPIIVRSGIGGFRGANVIVENNVCWGTNPNAPLVQDYTSTNEFAADFIVLQGVLGGAVRGNLVKYGGSAGTSITRGCENIVIDHNHFEMCYEPAINVGSGFSLVHVANVIGFYTVTNYDPENSTVNGIYSNNAVVSGGFISAIVPDEIGTGGWINVESTLGGVFALGNDFRQYGGAAPSTTITVAGTGAREAGQSVINSAHNIIVDYNLCFDTVVQGGAAAINFIRCLGENTVHYNSISNPKGQGQAIALLANANSRVGYGSNLWDAEFAGANRYTKAGPISTWLYQLHDLNLGGAIKSKAAAWVISSGAPKAGALNIAAVAKNNTGVYSVTLNTPLVDFQCSIMSVAVFGGIAGVATISGVSNTALTVRTFNMSGVPIDMAFWFEVKEISLAATV